MLNYDAKSAIIRDVIRAHMKSRVSTPAEDTRQNAFAQDKPLQQFANPLGFVDLRPQAIAQRKLQEMADNSPQAMQLKTYQAMMDARSARTVHMAGGGSPVVQLAAATVTDNGNGPKLKGYSDKASTANIKKTKVSFETGKLSTSKETVGISMVANPLGPDHPQGGEPSSSVAKKHISTHMKNNGVKIRGHLLNGDLGGPGSEQNLFPITAQANSHHYQYIEKRAKYWINDLKSWLRYEVKVTGRDDAKGIADFECELAPVDADGNDTQWLRKLKVHSEPDASTSEPSESDLGNKKAAMSDDTNFTDDDIEYSEGKTPVGYRPIEQDVEERMRIDAGKSTLGMSTLVWNLKQLSISEDSAEEIQSYIDSEDSAVFMNNNKGVWNRWVKNINENY
ncbi:hypothetical protein ACO0K9_09475 [Undibacterium sp. Ji50W]|uniref:hypothetical protein n=1 Tax=Undibacterium sp. Ji50W TaxID=3413041 RepID=UPI003BF32A5A